MPSDGEIMSLSEFEKMRFGGGVDIAPSEQLLRVERKMEQLLRGMNRMQSAILAQQTEISKLNRALDAVRVTRSQEIAIGEAIRARARQLCREESLPGMEKKIAGAIRVTLREVTGARAAGDIQQSQFARCIDLIGSWRMAGALRKMKKEAAQHER